MESEESNNDNAHRDAASRGPPMYMHSTSGRKDGWMSWLRGIALCVRFTAACAAAAAANTAYGAADDEPNGPPRALSFQVHDPEQASERRLALVIGNSTYSNAPLANPSNDARAMATKLRQVGFEVIEKENATREEIGRASCRERV